MGLKEANGITKAINLTTNLTALAVYLINGKVIFLLGLTAGLLVSQETISVQSVSIKAVQNS